MKFIRLIAFIGLAACATPENMFYEVTERTADGVSIHVNKGNMDLNSDMVARMLVHMDGMALSECQGKGKRLARQDRERAYTTGPYYSWIERTYTCI